MIPVTFEIKNGTEKGTSELAQKVEAKGVLLIENI